jgi:AcrR family transcriptional regulator
VVVARPGATTVARGDGRHRRRQENREAVLEALAALFAEGRYTPSSAEIAERAGLSPRSLFRYFDDTDDLNRAAIERQLRRAAPLLDPGVGPDDPTMSKIRSLAQSRVRLFDAIAPSARAARVCAHRHPIVRDQLRRDRTYLRRQLADVFSPELASAGDELLSGLDVLFSFESYDLLRSDQQLSGAQTIDALVSAARALVLHH